MGQKPDGAPARRVVERVAHALDAWRGARLLIAVSGGSDSVGLLRAVGLLQDRLFLEVEVAHLDHGVRGADAAADAAFVRELAAALAVPCRTGQWVPRSVSGFEASARQARYAWLADVAHQTGAAAVLVGHTRDDQAETILHRFLRGTGPRGLSGMPFRRELAPGVALLRPLLRIGREEVRSFLTGLGQSWREDSSNLDLTRTRARIRHVLLPELAGSFNPRVVEAIVRLGRLVGAERRLLEQRAARLARKCILEQHGTDRIDLDATRLRAISLADRINVFREVWNRLGWPEQAMSAKRWGRLARYGDGEGGMLAFPGGIEARNKDDRMILRRSAAEATETTIEPVCLPIPGSAAFGSGQLCAVLDPPDPPSWDEVVDADRLQPFGQEGARILLARPPRVGDRFEPLGLEGHTQPLADFLRGRRVLRDARSRVPVICDASGILWVAGHRIAHRVRCTEQTTRRIGLKWTPGCD